MTANTKSLILLAVTLVVGFALGLFGDAALGRMRRDQLGAMRRPPGFAVHMMDIIQPHSAVQADSIRSVVEATGQRNQQIIRGANIQLRAALDSMRAALAPMLDSGQRARLDEEMSRLPPFGRPRGGPGGPRGRGGPPPDGPPPGGPPGGPPPRL